MKRVVRVNDHAFVNRRPAEQHPVLHVLAVGQGDVDIPFEIANTCRCPDNVAKFFFAIGAYNFTSVDQRSGTKDFDIRAVGDGMNAKSYIGLLGRAEWFNSKRMQRRGARAGIDLDG